MTRLTAAKNRILRTAGHVAFGTRGWSDDIVEAIANSGSGRRVLEIGSGRQDLGADTYSLRSKFGVSDEFVQSDVNPAFGHEVVDVTTMDFDAEFDLVLCMYVLEHVFDPFAAARNLVRAVRPGGQVIVAVPHVYPYHDEPGDFWRFTEYALRGLFDGCARVDVRVRGPRRLPKGLLAVVTR